MALLTHLIEHVSMPEDGLSAKTGPLTNSLAEDHSFDSHASFLEALTRVETRVADAPEDTHLVVICTHGLEDTGTWLHMDDGLQDQRPENLPHNLIPEARGSVVLYLAVCWGGYPGVIRRFQHGQRPWPTVVGALAPLTATEGNELQDSVIDVLLAHGLDEARLSEVVSNFNARYQQEYGHPTARIACSDGHTVPRHGTAGIAWSLLRDEDDSPIDGPFKITHLLNERATVVCDSMTAAMPCGKLRLAKGAALAVDDQFRFKAKRSPCGRFLQVVGDVQLA
ncbi:MAG: hypothetical protein KF764_00915 [Labilithrix sp.]|nr:hypothetical protein [Labilithrix sp.]